MAQNQIREMGESLWEKMWSRNLLGWDMGEASPPLAQYLQQYPNKDAAVLIPGCGSAYEAEIMLATGFTDITLLDISQTAVEFLKEKFKNFPEVKVIHGSFFDHEGEYDLIIEQTLFCTVYPERRDEYAYKAASLLKEGGKLVGVFFNTCLGPSGPPFGGDSEDYRKVFEPYFEIDILEDCYNSFPSRDGQEYFIKLKKSDMF